MKKILIAILMLMGTFSMASAELGINVGVSGTLGVFEAKAHENEDGEISAQKSAVGAFGYGSIFIEKSFADRIAIGLDYVPGSLESEKAEEAGTDGTPSVADGTAVSNTVQVDFEDYTTLYLSVNLTDNFYVMAGVATVDVATNENLGTGSVYPNATLDGEVYGAGYNLSFDNGMFVRAEASVVQFGNLKVTSSTACHGTGCANNFIVVDDVNGASAKISVGRTF